MEFIKKELRLCALIASSIMVWWAIFEGIVYIDKNLNTLEKAGFSPLQNIIFIFAVPTLFVIFFYRIGRKIQR